MGEECVFPKDPEASQGDDLPDQLTSDINNLIHNVPDVGHVTVMHNINRMWETKKTRRMNLVALHERDNKKHKEAAEKQKQTNMHRAVNEQLRKKEATDSHKREQ